MTEYATAKVIGERMKFYRERVGLTFRELGDLSGVSIGIIHRLENGKNIELRNFLAIADALPVSIHAILCK